MRFQGHCALTIKKRLWWKKEIFIYYVNVLSTCVCEWMERWCGGGWVALNVVGGPNITIRTGGDLELYITATLYTLIYTWICISTFNNERFSWKIILLLNVLPCWFADSIHTPFVFMLWQPMFSFFLGYLYCVYY